MFFQTIDLRNYITGRKFFAEIYCREKALHQLGALIPPQLSNSSVCSFLPCRQSVPFCFNAMKSNAVCLFAGLVLAVSSAFAQAINVTQTGVDMGATTPTTSGALLQQSGQTTTFWAQDGVNAPTLLVKIQGDGKVGVGTSTPSEKLEVAGNLKVNSAVLAPAGSAPMFAARAWVNFNGTGSNGTDQVIRASGNVTRVYKSATGTYTIYFTTAMPDGNYCIAGSASIDGGGSSGRMVLPVSATASEAQIELRAGGGGLNSSTIVHVVFYR
jgi:hypothetical protein